MPSVRTSLIDAIGAPAPRGRSLAGFTIIVALAAAGATFAQSSDPLPMRAVDGSSDERRRRGRDVLSMDVIGGVPGGGHDEKARRFTPERAVEAPVMGHIDESHWLDGAHLTGDWGGARSWLSENGVELEINYTSDFFYSFRGGLNTSDAEQYRGLLAAGLTVDTERAGLWRGGTWHVSMLNIHGTDITARHVGDLQVLNNSDAPNDTLLYELWYEQRFLDGKVRLKLGRMDANADFAAPLYGEGFINSTSGINPTLPIPQYPDSALGMALIVEPVDWMFVGAGIYDALGVGTRSGFDTAFHTPEETVSVAELGVRAAPRLWGDVPLPGLYRVGGFYHSGEFDEIFDDLDGRRAPRVHRGNAGLYVILDQTLYREDPAAEGCDQGLTGFFQFAWVPSKYNEIAQVYDLGFRYSGLFPGREADVVGLAAHHVSLSGEVQSLERRYSETAVELFYQWQLTDAISIKPDVQYIANPGGDGRDAIVGGVRVEIAF